MRARWRLNLLAGSIAFAVAASGILPLAAAAPAERPVTTRSAVNAELAERAPEEFREFYAARNWSPLWLTDTGTVRPAVFALLRDAEDAHLDGLRPGTLKTRDLRRALDRVGDRTPASRARLELAASRVYAAYVSAVRAAARAPMLYESAALTPVVPATGAALQEAERAPSLDHHVADMGWMHPLYAPLRRALLQPDLGEAERRIVEMNLERIRALPAWPADRYVLVDAAGQRLWMYEKGRPVDSMRVVVGKTAEPTPMMAGYLRFAILNPYWNVPVDLAASRIARNVLDHGQSYLKAGRYQVLSGWDDDATVVNPAKVDWHAVAEGRQEIRVRQLPGGTNFMGRVKFMFPNTLGIYLHDTPDKDLMQKDDRTFSSGCVRLEDASRFGRWLFGKPLPRKVAGAEKRVELPKPVPVYITYLTAFPESTGPANESAIAFRSDPYGRDGVSRAVPSVPAFSRDAVAAMR
ncbi:MAG: L,D-transpeptidase family protein [Pseudomonadota bacterium]